MQIFGLDPIIVTVIITISGVLIQNIFGWLKNDGSFNPRQAAASAMIAVFSGIALVGTSVGAIAEGTGDLEAFMILAALVATIAGFDSLAKNGIKAATKALSKKSE